MKKPYLKKAGKFSGFDVYYVNGYWIRKNLDINFTNYGQHYRFNFIPKNEFWIDMESGRKETKYFVNSLILEHRLMEAGKTYSRAVGIANKIEKKERDKSKFVRNLKKIKLKEKILEKLHKKRLFKKYTEKLKIWLVKGDIVRNLFYIDFTEGGHDRVYNFVPKNEIWIDDDLYKKEIALVLIHELHERAIMLKGENYKCGHKKALEIELWCRRHPKSIKKILLKEIKKNEKLSSNQKSGKS